MQELRRRRKPRNYLEIDIADIVSAVENLRDAVPRLSAEGYGVFQGTTKQPASLASLALSKDSLQQKDYLTLIEDHEPEIESLAGNLATMGLLEPIRVRTTEEKNKYDLIFGCRRCLAWLYNFAKSGGKIPSRITAEVVEAEGKDSLLTSLSENLRVEPSPIDEAKSFRKLEKTFGMKAPEIADVRRAKDEKKVVRRSG